MGPLAQIVKFITLNSFQSFHGMLSGETYNLSTSFHQSTHIQWGTQPASTSHSLDAPTKTATLMAIHL